MKKILSKILAAAVAVASIGSIAQAEAPVSSDVIYGWNVIESLNTDTALHDTVVLTEDEAYGQVVEITKESPSITNSKLGIYQIIPADKVTFGNTYVIEYKYNLYKTSGNYWLLAGFHSWNPAYMTQPASSVDADKGWKSISRSVTYTEKIYGADGGLPVYLFTANGAAHLQLADIVVYDKADETKTNLLVNGDFSEGYSKIENAEYKDGTLTWTLPEDMKGTGINIYRRDISGSSELINTDLPIPASDLSAKLNLNTDSSFYLDIYTCAGTKQVRQTLVTIEVLGDIDFGVSKLSNGEAEITKPEQGTLTVSVPVRNNKLEEGLDVEVIVLLKEANATVGVAKSLYNIAKAEEIIDCTVDIEVGEVTENTSIEVYVWDGIDSMNVLRDVSIF